MADKPRILFIDDDPGLSRLAERALSRRGYDVTTASSGAEGIARAGAERFDLVAVDHYMPGQNGLETLAGLMALPTPPPVVYVTGSEESRVAVAALKAGAVDYVVKAVGDDFFDLLDSVFTQSLATATIHAAKDRAEAQLRASNERLQALLREVNHRVANSLQIVSAFVAMQASTLSDPAATGALEDTQRRVAAIAQVHKRLYTTDDVESVEMDSYLAALVAELEQTWSTPSSPRSIRLTTDPIKLKTDKAVSIGIIVNELVSNACKYAYPARASGEVRIGLHAVGDKHFSLTVEDDGQGMPSEKPADGTGIGSKLIKAMAQSLRASVTYVDGNPGLRAELNALC